VIDALEIEGGLLTSPTKQLSLASYPPSNWHNSELCWSLGELNLASYICRRAAHEVVSAVPLWVVEDTKCTVTIQYMSQPLPNSPTQFPTPQHYAIYTYGIA